MIAMFLSLACTGTTTNDTGATSPPTDDTATPDTTTPVDECLEPIDTGGEGTIAEECCFDPATVTLYGGDDEPMLLEEGGALPLAYSPQYGWELLLFPKICQTRNLAQVRALLSDTATGAVLVDETGTDPLYPDAEGSCCGDDFLLLSRLDTSGLPDEGATSLGAALCDRPVQLTVQVTDADGRAASSSLRLVVWADPEAMGHACGDAPGDTGE